MKPATKSDLLPKKIVGGMALGLVSYLLSAGFVMLVSRLAPSTHDFGIFISAQALLSSLGLLVGLGLDATAASMGYRYIVEKRYSLLRALRNIHLIWVLALSGFLAVLAFLHWGLRENFYSVPADVDALILISWAAAAISIETSQVALLTALDRPVIASLLDKGLSGLLTVVLGGSLLWFFQPNHTFWAIGGVVIANLILSLICFLFVSSAFKKIKIESESVAEQPPIKDWISSGYVSQITFILTSEVTPLFIAVSRLDRTDLALVGAFGALFVASKVVVVPFSGLQHLVSRRFDELIVNQNAGVIWRELRRLWLWVAILTGGFALIAVFFGPTLLSAFGPSFAVYDWELAAICVGLGFVEASKPVALVPGRTGQTVKLAAAAAACLPVGLLVTGAAAIRDSIAGMAAGFLIFAALQFGLTVRIARNITKQWPTRAPSD